MMRGCRACEMKTEMQIRMSKRLGLPAACMAVAALLLSRDVFGGTVNRWLLLAVIAVALLLLDAGETRLFVFFLMPLYAGLPGNFITLLLLLKFCVLALREEQRFHFPVRAVVCGMLFAVYVLIQNLMQDSASVYAFALCAEIPLLLFLSADRAPFPPRRAANIYTVSVVLAGVCALSVYAGEHSLAEIMSGAIRFGDTYGAGGMRMELDPNFLGFFCLSGIAAHIELLRRRMHRSFWGWVFSVLLIMTLGFLGLIGLSRAFLLCLGGLVFLELAACARSPKRFFHAVLFTFFMIGAGTACLHLTAPSLLPAAAERFTDADLWNGNGRAALIVRWWHAFLESPRTLLLGTGLFRTNVHVTALQYLFGLGLVGSIPAFCFAGACARSVGFRIFRGGWIPAVTVAVMSCTVPAACSLSALFPLVFTVCFSAHFGGAELPETAE